MSAAPADASVPHSQTREARTFGGSGIPTLPPMPLSDRDLIRAARRGDREAADALARRYWEPAWKASLALSGNRHLADDATQDAFERVLRNLSRIDEKRPFGAYLHRVVINRTLDLLRAGARTAKLHDSPDARASLERSLDAMSFEQIVSRLPEERRVPVVLRYLLDYKPSEIAELLGIPEGTVSSRLARGMAELRDGLEEAP